MHRFLGVVVLGTLSSLALSSCDGAAPSGQSSPALECGEPVGEAAIGLRPNGFAVEGRGGPASSTSELDPSEVCSRHECFDLCGDTIVMAQPSTLPALTVQSSLVLKPGVASEYRNGTVAVARSSIGVFDASRSLLGETRLSGSGLELEVIDDLAFVRSASDHRHYYMQVVDLSDSSAPRVLSRWSMLDDERGFLPRLVGQVGGQLVVAGSTSVAYLTVEADGTPEVTRCMPIPFIDGGGWYWDIDINDRFLVVSGVPRDESQGATAYVYPSGGNDRYAIDIRMENTPILDGDRLLLTTPDRQGAVYRLRQSQPPSLEAVLARPFFQWEPPLRAGFAFLDDDFVVDLRSDDLAVYEYLDSNEELSVAEFLSRTAYDCVIELASGGSRVAIAPYLSPNGRFPIDGVPEHECGSSAWGSTIIDSRGVEAVASTRECGLMHITRRAGMPDPLVDSPEAQAVLDRARRIHLWDGDRIVVEGYSSIDIVSHDTGMVITEGGALPGAVRDVGVGGNRLVVLAEPFYVGDVEEPHAPPRDWLVFTMDVQAQSPTLVSVEKPADRQIAQVAIDEQAIYGVAYDGRLHRWPLAGGETTSTDFLPGAPKELLISELGMFGSTDDGWWHSDGMSVRPIVAGHPRASIAGVDDQYVYLHYPPGDTFIAPNDEHLVVARPSFTDTAVEMLPSHATPVSSSSTFVPGESITLTPLTFFARPGGQ